MKLYTLSYLFNTIGECSFHSFCLFLSYYSKLESKRLCLGIVYTKQKSTVVVVGREDAEDEKQNWEGQQQQEEREQHECACSQGLTRRDDTDAN